MTITKIRRIELYVVTVFAVLVFCLDFEFKYNEAIRILSRMSLEDEPTSFFDLWQNIFFPLLSIYVAVLGCWLLVHYYTIPKWFIEKKLFKTGLLLLLGLGVIVLGVYLQLSWFKEIRFKYDYDPSKDLKTIIGTKVFSVFRIRYWLELVVSATFLIVIYEILAQLFYKFHKQNKESNSTQTKIYYETILVACLYFVFRISRLLFRQKGFQIRSYFRWDYYGSYWENTFNLDIVFDLFVCAFFIFLHSWAYHSIFMMDKEQRKTKDWFRYLFVGSVIYYLIQLYIKADYQSNNLFDYPIFYLFVVLSPVTAFARYIYTRPKIITERLTRKLTQNQAELSSLKAQINPHFLFNAMNTLYATAIEERAEQTTKGIHQLSEMMRFMMNENNQDQIDIQSEVQYLRNYIDLQRLRFVESDKFELKVELDDSLCLHSIAPMLLVPFVENAFKHGISLRQTSWIYVKLYCQNQRLHFSVFNSLHPKQDQDPEKYSSGIGLVNVKKRLDLLYAKMHSLTIHRTEKEFSVVLEIDFTSKQPKSDPALAFYTD